VYGRSEREVIVKIRELRREAERGRDLSQPSMALRTFIYDLWLPMKESDGTRASTLRSYRWLLNSHIVPALGSRALDQLTSAEVQRFIGAKRSSTLSLTSCNHVLRLLRNLLGDAEDMGLVSRDVAKAVKLAKVEPRSVPALDVAGARRLLDSIQGHRLEALFASILVLGLRRGEALGLRWADVDFESGLVRVRQTLQRLDGQLRLEEITKTRASTAVLAVPPSLLELLTRHRRQQQKDRLVLGPLWPDFDLVFRSTIGTPLEPRNASREWEKVRVTAGLPTLRLHDLRHSCATILTAQGVHPRVIMEMLRHSQISITMNTYSHVAPELQREAAEVLERALFG
jgi:integrase